MIKKMQHFLVNSKKLALAIISILLLSVAGIFICQPLLFKAILAKYKSTDHFLVLAEDTRIYYEQGAQDNALALQKILPASQKNVERILNVHFEKAIAAYVCSSQDSFNEYVFLSKNVRGAVYWEKLFLSPGAFDRGEESLAELTTHELTHYLFNTHLGEKAHIEKIPLWFREGIAVFVANGGAGYTKDKQVSDLISSKEKAAYLSGELNFWFVSQNPADALAKNGTANWLVYRVSALLLHYLHDTRPDSFEKLTGLLLSGVAFDQAIEASYGKKIDVLFKEFSQYLNAEK